jgi:hypothetical protein
LLISIRDILHLLLWRRILVAVLTAFLVLGGWFYYAGQGLEMVRAQDTTPPHHRTATLNVQYIEYSWWLARYSTNRIVCALKVEHEGVPNYNEIEGLCGKDVAEDWLDSQPCSLAEIDAKQCPGLYLIQLGSQQKQRQVEVELPLPSVWIKVVNCNPLPGQRKCTTLPNLVLHAEEPLPNETILSVQGTINGEPFSCPGGDCALPMGPTGLEGVSMEFWANSSFGDASEHYTARIRLVPWGDFANPENKSADPNAWYVDVLSSQWTGEDQASCSSTWQVFPPLEGPPDWLSSPDNVEGLHSESGFYYLAAQLIQAGIADASNCLDKGLQSANVASACGVEAARPMLVEWQNRFDGQIVDVSKSSGVPSRLLKSVFIRESQIWPGIFTTYQEAGLGQLTENGADTVLLWNPDFFHQFCPLVLSKAYCDLGFGNLKAPEQAILRGALVRTVDSSCQGCPAGIDISQANFSVRVFANGLLANCEQVGRILQNVTGQDAGRSSSYEDLWRFTLVNYNAGPGCLSRAVKLVVASGESINWDNVSARLEPGCQGAIGYVEDISGIKKVEPTPTPWIQSNGPLVTPDYPRVDTSPTARPTGLVRTATPTPTVTATPTQLSSLVDTQTSPTATPTVTPAP